MGWRSTKPIPYLLLPASLNCGTRKSLEGERRIVDDCFDYGEERLLTLGVLAGRLVVIRPRPAR